MSKLKVKNGDRWGDWVLNFEPRDNPSLDYVGKWYRNDPYWIRLSELQTRAALDHWMEHLSEKDWGQESMGDFVRAVTAVTNLGENKCQINKSTASD
jgi:hypothetical protein